MQKIRYQCINLLNNIKILFRAFFAQKTQNMIFPKKVFEVNFRPTIKPVIYHFLTQF